MPWLLGLIGLFVGTFLGGALFHNGLGIGAVFGALVGVLFGRQSVLQGRLRQVEQELENLQLTRALRERFEPEEPAPRRAPAAPPPIPPAATPAAARSAAPQVHEPMQPVTHSEPGGDLPPLDFDLSDIVIPPAPPPKPQPAADAAARPQRAVFEIGDGPEPVRPAARPAASTQSAQAAQSAPRAGAAGRVPPGRRAPGETVLPVRPAAA
ncbi:hypothetical protein ACFJIW_07010 [Tahibacter sp. UC22_41]|uniref:hypothetical protein n=1 Tax=Tahibacter sp. UC22_41 TaxID=3350178 RepID=UPI0036D7EDE2